MREREGEVGDGDVGRETEQAEVERGPAQHAVERR